MLAPITLALAVLATQVAAQAAQWGQCGGQGWNGATYCQNGLQCRYQNDYYSQCLAPDEHPDWDQGQGGDEEWDEGDDEGWDQGDEGDDEGYDEGYDKK